MFWGFVFRLFVGAFVAPIAFSFMLIPLASLLALTMRGAVAKPSPIRTYPIFALLFLAQMYFWGLWAAYCAYLATTCAADANVGHRWLYYVVAFLFVTAPLGYLSGMERSSAGSAAEDRAVQKGSGLYAGLTIIAFLVFAISPPLVVPAYGWFVAFAVPVEGRARLVLEEKYFGILDRWVARGGPTKEIQTVVQTCDKLVMLESSSPTEILRLSTIDRDEFRFRADVCTKMTANRVYPQPEFRDKTMVSMICDGN